MAQCGTASAFDRHELPIKIGQPNGEKNVAEPKLNAASLDLRPFYYFVHVVDTAAFRVLRPPCQLASRSSAVQFVVWSKISRSRFCIAMDAA